MAKMGHFLDTSCEVFISWRVREVVVAGRNFYCSYVYYISGFTM